ncbi:radical SAM protein [Candidatus Woesearchaeota archaeon]|nr:radical SAM protein [Candidatus Woesearchaeota archaeon]
MNGNYILKINNLCNLNCCFCADSIEERSKPDFYYNCLVDGLIENRKKFDTLIITGGEPTIYPKLLQLIDCAKNVKYKKISLTTNGVMLHDASNVEKLSCAGVDAFLISFSTSEERMFDSIVKKAGSFERVVQGIKNVKNVGKEVRINTALHKLNYKNLAKTVRLLIELKVDAIQLSFLNPVGSSIVQGKSAIALKYGDMISGVNDSFEVAQKFGFKNLYIENFPICVAPNLVSKISDLRKPEENKDYYNSCKKKPEKCGSCSFNDICDGVWEAYLEQFGNEELRPVSYIDSLEIVKTI